MTIEEKAKRYDEAIAHAKLLLKTIGNATLGNLVLKNEFENMFPELKESEDENIRKELMEQVVYIVPDKNETDNEGNVLPSYQKRIDKYISWLEKQGEQKPKWTEEGIREAQLDYWRSVGGKEWYGVPVQETIAWLEKQGEQKSTDKVKPKFHEGEWITNGDYTWKIVEVKPLDYILQSQDGNIVDDTISHVDEQFHSFTIEDAKTGDVLAYRGEQWIFIYKERKGETLIKYYALASEKELDINDVAFTLLLSCIVPATKEQRDLLFQKMKEAGYEWDAEKKELKKVEQKPTEEVDLPEFESYLCLMLQKFRTKGMCTNGEIIDYVEEHSQKLRDILVKPAWGEQDKCMLNNVIDTLKPLSQVTHSGYAINSMINWLKSLRPQNTWKPSGLPHWQKSNLPNHPTTGFNSDYFCHKGYCINYKELFEKLPKDD